MDTVTTIKDSRIKVKASKDLVDLLIKHRKHLIDVPENINQFFQTYSIETASNIEIITDDRYNKSEGINIKLLKELLEEEPPKNETINEEDRKPIHESKNIKTNNMDLYLYLSDLRWLNNFLAKLRKDEGIDIYLNEILTACNLELPKNDIIKRNPELEARCQKLREEQQNLEYRKMTKNVDAVLKHYPEDTIAYQIKAINSQMIAVLQFIFSVAAGFAFGFLGINLIVGNIEFGLRLLLGIMCALIIALAEIYFLAKKLSEYDNTVDTVNKALRKTVQPAKKSHTD